MIRRRRVEEVRAVRLVAVVDEPFTYRFFEDHVVTPGTEWIVGTQPGQVVLEANGDLSMYPGPECRIVVPWGKYHLEREVETWDAEVRTERTPVGFL